MRALPRNLAVVVLAGWVSLVGIALSTEASPLRSDLRAALAADSQSNGTGARLRARLPLAAKSALLSELGAGSYPVVPSFLIGAADALANPNASPPGSNVACKLTARHPRPLVLIHGTAEDMEDNWGAIAPILANNGYCVYALNYGGAPGSILQALGPIPDSAITVASFIDHIRSVTGAAKVDVVGHSQGGTVLEYVAKLLGRANEIGSLVGIVPSTHGTTASGLLTLTQLIPGANGILGDACPACAEQEIGSPVLQKLDAPPIAVHGPAYTVIETTTDEVITPSSGAFINEPGVKNEYIQSTCPFDAAEHINITYDLVSIQLLLNALDPATARRPNCFLAFPIPA